MAVQARLDPRCVLEDAASVPTPALVLYPELIRENLASVLEIAGDPARLRPHVKTHKTRELIEIELAAGIVRHKCATLAEADLLASTGIKDVVLAYTLVGPNIERFVSLVKHYPDCRFAPLVDDAGAAKALGNALDAKGLSAEILLDLDVGLGRTGIAPGPEALDLYAWLARLPGLAAGGLHVYDGHNKQEDVADRRAATREIWGIVRAFAASLEDRGLAVPRIVAGGTGTFPCWAEIAREDPRIECSPGTFFLNDWNYFKGYADLPLPPAAVLLTRVISRPRPGRMTLDLGSKAVASDPPLRERVRLLGIDDAVIVRQNEEHLVIDAPAADRFRPGDLLYAWPAHICPTCALYPELLVAEKNRIVASWPVAARDRAPPV